MLHTTRRDGFRVTWSVDRGTIRVHRIEDAGKAETVELPHLPDLGAVQPLMPRSVWNAVRLEYEMRLRPEVVAKG